jgi:hypothetical protein
MAWLPNMRLGRRAVIRVPLYCRGAAPNFGIRCHKFVAVSNLLPTSMYRTRMGLTSLPAYVLSVSFLAVSGCVGTPTVARPEVPSNLRPPSGEVLFLEARASGVQIYECGPTPGQTQTYAWIFQGPEAALVDRFGRSLGKHYGGPTWESNDGSSVVGSVKASASGPRADSIPWLLLTSKATSGSGAFSATTSIQRVRTLGGIAPSEACSASNSAQMARVPYTATYYFYRAAR